MKKNLILKVLGLFYFAVGMVLHINMMLEKSWPTYFFILICVLGVLLIIISFLAKNLSWKIQGIIGLLSIFIFLLLLFI
ncbi:hypothetical protein DTW91_04350 [Chryseobacterium sp. SC28]|nr:hypothetical protein DTW91_04350 [Chryseobacterium sp. SC28]